MKIGIALNLRLAESLGEVAQRPGKQEDEEKKGGEQRHSFSLSRYYVITRDFPPARRNYDAEGNARSHVERDKAAMNSSPGG